MRSSRRSCTAGGSEDGAPVATVLVSHKSSVGIEMGQSQSESWSGVTEFWCTTPVGRALRRHFRGPQRAFQRPLNGLWPKFFQDLVHVLLHLGGRGGSLMGFGMRVRLRNNQVWNL